MLLSAIVNPFSLQNSDADPNAADEEEDDDDVCASSQPPPVVTLADVIDDTAFARPDPKTEEEYALSADEKSDGDDDETTWSASDPDSTDDAVSGATNSESVDSSVIGDRLPHPSTMISSNRNPLSFTTIIRCNNGGGQSSDFELPHADGLEEAAATRATPVATTSLCSSLP